MHNLINLLSCYTWCNYGMTCISRFSCNPTRLSQFLYILLIFDNRYLFVCKLLEVRVWLPTLSVIRLLHTVWNSTLSCEAVGERS